MKLLLHFCCGPCGVSCVDELRRQKIDFSGFWYNPNIHPFTEYRSRKNSFLDFSKSANFPTVVNDEYGLRPFVQAVAEDIPGRCSYCYAVRMNETARTAKEQGYDAFSTTLLISPYQNHEAIIRAAQAAAREHDIDFFYCDFRPFFREGQAKARESGLYMQKFCGCIFSEEERYSKAFRKKKG